MKRVLTVALALWSLCSFAHAEADPQETFDSLFGPAYRAARASRDGADDVALAGKLLDAAKSVSDAPGFQALLLDKSAELGLRDPQGYPTARAALELKLQTFPDQAEQTRQKIYQLAELRFRNSSRRDKTHAGRDLIRVCIRLGEAYQAQGEYDRAIGMYRRGQAIDRSLKTGAEAELANGIAAATQKKLVAARCKVYEDRLQRNPADAAAARQLALLHLLENDDPQTADKYLPAAADEVLNTYLPLLDKETAEIPAEACLAMAQWFGDLAKDPFTDQGRGRAASYCKTYAQQFLAGHEKEDVQALKAKLLVDRADKILAEVGPSSSPAGRGGQIDLMKLVDPKLHAVEGKWSLKQGALVTDATRFSRITLPVQVDGDYQVTVSFFQEQRGEVAIYLPYKGGDTVLAIGPNGRVGFRSFRGARRSKPRGSAGVALKKLHTAGVRVRSDGKEVHIQVDVDGKGALDWKGPVDRLYTYRGWRMPHDRALGVGAWSTAVAFKQIRVKMLSGTHEPLKVEPKPAATEGPEGDG